MKKKKKYYKIKRFGVVTSKGIIGSIYDTNRKNTEKLARRHRLLLLK